jgi:hypothetical protein
VSVAVASALLDATVASLSTDVVGRDWVGSLEAVPSASSLLHPGSAAARQVPVAARNRRRRIDPVSCSVVSPPAI